MTEQEENQAIAAYVKHLNEQVNKVGSAILDLIDRDDANFVASLGMHIFLNGAVYQSDDDTELNETMNRQFTAIKEQVFAIREQMRNEREADDAPDADN